MAILRPAKSYPLKLQAKPHMYMDKKEHTFKIACASVAEEEDMRHFQYNSLVPW